MNITLAICFTCIVAQLLHQRHQRNTQTDSERLELIEGRVCELEAARKTAFDSVAFEEIKTKVEALRIGQGLRLR